MDKYLLTFVLPDAGAAASINVRAACLLNYSPPSFEFRLHNTSFLSIENKILRKVLRTLFWGIWNFIQIKINIDSKILFFIKNYSLVNIVLCKIWGYKIFIDVNDPIHMREFLGIFSRLKFLILLKIADGIVFESAENHELWKNKVSNKSVIIEDSPQFEFIDLVDNLRSKSVVWYGSPDTSEVLFDYIEYFKDFAKLGYKIKLLGCQEKLIKILSDSGILVEYYPSYDFAFLKSVLTDAEISFVPMPNTDLYNLRGNLKAKIGMACGCIVFSSNNMMHQRLINDGEDGFLFNSHFDFAESLGKLSQDKNIKNIISLKASKKVLQKFTPRIHAEKLCSFIFGDRYEKIL